MSLHWYKVTYVPPGCTEFDLDEELQLDTVEPPPPMITLGEGNCQGVEAELIE